MKNYPPALYGFLAGLAFASLIMWIATVTHRCADREHMTIPLSCGGHYYRLVR